MVRESKFLRRLIPAFGLALVASLALTGIAASSAPAATQHWNVCKNNYGFKNYKDSACSEETSAGLGAYGLQKLAEGSSTGLTMKNTSNYVLSWPAWGINFQLSCSVQLSEEATVENPTGGGAGKAHLVFVLRNCYTTTPSGCYNLDGPVKMYVDGEATEFGGKPALRLYNPNAVNLISITLTGDKCDFKGTKFTFQGELMGVMSKGGSLEFTETSSSLNWGGWKTTLTGTSSVKNTAGESLVLAP